MKPAPSLISCGSPSASTAVCPLGMVPTMSSHTYTLTSRSVPAGKLAHSATVSAPLQCCTQKSTSSSARTVDENMSSRRFNSFSTEGSVSKAASRLRASPAVRHARGSGSRVCGAHDGVATATKCTLMSVIL